MINYVNLVSCNVIGYYMHVDDDDDDDYCCCCFSGWTVVDGVMPVRYDEIAESFYKQNVNISGMLRVYVCAMLMHIMVSIDRQLFVDRLLWH
jgi:hypothetical protein